MWSEKRDVNYKSTWFRRVDRGNDDGIVMRIGGIRTEENLGKS